ncbi:MAG: hypothetical protein AAFZ15_10805 [Bacteroidota bacterium]
MKITKRILPALLLLLIAVFAMHAQRADRQFDPEKMAEKQTAHMTEKLSLDEQQVEKVKAINLKYAEQAKVQKEQAEAERATKRAERQKIQEAKKAELKEVLTDEQFAEMEKMQAARAEKVKMRKEGRRKGQDNRKSMSPEDRAAKMTEKMTEQLGLNKDQVTELEKVNLEFAQKRQAIIEKNKEQRAAGKESMQQLKEEQKAAMEKILTPEQMKQLEEIRPEKGQHRRGRRGGVNDGRM